jgi:hypothetical protein
MCLLCGMNWVFIPHKTAFFIATSVRTSKLICQLTQLRGISLLLMYTFLQLSSKSRIVAAAYIMKLKEYYNLRCNPALFGGNGPDLYCC